MEIAHKYLIQHYPLKDVALLHQIKPASVSYLARKVQKDGSILSECQAAEQKKTEEKTAIIAAAVKLDKTADGILKSEDVVEEVRESSQLVVKKLLV